MARPKKATTVAETTEKNAYRVVVGVGGVSYPLSGANVPEAITKFPPVKIGGKILIDVSRGAKTYQFVLKPLSFKRLQNNEKYALWIQGRCDYFLTK